jgi:hypothetical protein
MKGDIPMKKPVILILVLLVTLFVAVAPALAQDEPDLVRFVVDNQTDGEVIISLAGQGVTYYLAVADGTTRTFTVERGMYDMHSSACATPVQGTLDASTQVRLRFLPCWGSLSNFGEPTREVVNLLAPPPQLWRFQFNK